jgi:hypothetical protein
MKSEVIDLNLRTSCLAMALLLMSAASQFGFTQQTSARATTTDLRSFLVSYLGASSSDTDRADSRYLTATVDLNGDGQPETIVYLLGNNWCGSGGCTMLVLTTQNAHYKVMTRITITQLPIRVLSTSTNGWRDLAVTVAGGGILHGYEAKLAFNGRKYPSNPTIAAAAKLPANTAGTTLIQLGAESRAIPLFR